MSNQDALAADADAQQKFLNNKVNIFLFDLMNEAKEYGFKAGESWNIEIVTDSEMRSLKRIHHPVVSLKLKPEDMLHVYQQVKDKMKQSIQKTETELSAVEIERDSKDFLAAYPARILRK